MLYINQLDYPHLKYNHNTLKGGPPEGRDTVKTSGCGLCCACMVVDQLTDKSLGIEECVRLSEDSGANQWIGTSMKVLGNVLAEKYDLEFSYTKDVDEAIAHLGKGGRVIALVGKDNEGNPGLFAKVAHYVLLLSYDGKEFCVLDPALTDVKYTEGEKAGRVRVNKPFVYAPKEEIEIATQAQGIKYYLFSRK